MHTILGPGLGTLGQKNRRAHQSPRREQRRMMAAEEANVSADAVAASDLVSDCHATDPVETRLRVGGECSKPQQSGDEHGESDAAPPTRSTRASRRGMASVVRDALEAIVGAVAPAGGGRCRCEVGAMKWSTR